MKRIIILFALLFLVTGCGPHFLGKPEPYVPEPVSKGVKVPVSPAPQNVTISVPNWPGWGYTTEAKDAFIILVVKDPSKFPVPETFTFKKDGEQPPIVLKVIPR